MGAVKNTLQHLTTNWAGQLTNLARSYAPAHIRDAISSKTEEKGEGTFIIRITADRRIAPDARAWEYGSGLKARRGTKQKYDINGKPKLVFMGTNDFVGKLIITPTVHHPGIQAANGGKGYIAPAVKELRVKGRQELVTEVRQAILSDIRASFGRKS